MRATCTAGGWPSQRVENWVEDGVGAIEENVGLSGTKHAKLHSRGIYEKKRREGREDEEMIGNRTSLQQQDFCRCRVQKS